jgi:hypothetical protein
LSVFSSIATIDDIVEEGVEFLKDAVPDRKAYISSPSSS